MSIHATMSINDDYETVRAAIVAIERIRADYARYHDAAERVTKLINAKHRDPHVSAGFTVFEREVRKAMGDTYAGGPLERLPE